MLKKLILRPIYLGIAMTTLLGFQHTLMAQESAKHSVDKNLAPSLQAQPTQQPMQEIPLKAQASQLIKQFAGQLQAELQGAIKTGGLEAGVKVCHSRAPEIAKELSLNGWELARTSLKTRNEANKPDEWEYAVMQDFAARYQAGEPHTSLVATANEPESFRLMKAIPTGQICLACHGSSVDSKVQATIKEHYPNDQATGFTLKDLRGAFTLKKAL